MPQPASCTALGGGGSLAAVSGYKSTIHVSSAAAFIYTQKQKKSTDIKTAGHLLGNTDKFS